MLQIITPFVVCANGIDNFMTGFINNSKLAQKIKINTLVDLVG